MNMLDVFIGVFMGVGAYYGWKKGLIMALFNLVAIVLGLYIAFHFSNQIALLFVSSSDGVIVPLLFFILVLIGVYYLIKLAGKMFERSVKFAWPSTLNNVFGALTGALKWSFMVGSFLLLFASVDSSNTLLSSDVKSNSLFYDFVTGFAENIMPGVKSTLILSKNTILS